MLEIMKIKLVKLLANLGYGSRKEVDKLLRIGAVTDAAGVARVPGGRAWGGGASCAPLGAVAKGRARERGTGLAERG